MMAEKGAFRQALTNLTANIGFGPTRSDRRRFLQRVGAAGAGVGVFGVSACVPESSRPENNGSVDPSRVEHFADEKRYQFLSVYDNDKYERFRGADDTNEKKSLSVSQDGITDTYVVITEIDGSIKSISFLHSILESEESKTVRAEEGFRLTKEANGKDWTYYSFMTEQGNTEERSIGTNPQETPAQRLLDENFFSEVVQLQVDFYWAGFVAELER